MFLLSLSLSLSLSFHPDTVIDKPTKDVIYILPCTWRCSCNWKKVYKGWTVLIKGKIYHVEGDRKDGKQTPSCFYNPNVQSNSKK